MFKRLSKNLALQADLALFYIHLPKGLGEVGERWDRSSYIQAVGFAILVAGTLVYGKGDEEEEAKQVSLSSLALTPILWIIQLQRLSLTK